MKLIELSESNTNKYLKEFFSCLKDGYEFEKFLKLFLENLDLDEIEVTQRSRDGGIDLIALRNGVGDYSNADAINYYIQAKKYKPGIPVGVKALRELKGVIPFGHKGILITTSHFTKDVYKEANNDPSKPVTLIDGKILLNECIKYEIGFTYEPKFSIEEFNKYINKSSNNSDGNNNTCMNNEKDVNETSLNYIMKEITANDIRARIISVPSTIAYSLKDRKEYTIDFEGNIFKSKFIGGRNYFSCGMSAVYRKNGLLSKDNVINPSKAKWILKDEDIIIRLEK